MKLFMIKKMILKWAELQQHGNIALSSFASLPFFEKLDAIAERLRHMHLE